MIRLKALLVKEFLQMQRDKAVIFMMILIPVIQLLLFGFAINTDVKHLPTIVFDQCLQEESRDLLSSFTASGYFDVKEVATGYDQVNAAVDSGRAKVGISIPPDFAENLKHGRTAAVQVIVDASDSMTASSAISAAQVIGQLKSQNIIFNRYQQLTGQKLQTPYDIRIRPLSIKNAPTLGNSYSDFALSVGAAGNVVDRIQQQIGVRLQDGFNRFEGGIYRAAAIGGGAMLDAIDSQGDLSAWCFASL